MSFYLLSFLMSVSEPDGWHDSCSHIYYKLYHLWYYLYHWYFYFHIFIHVYMFWIFLEFLGFRCCSISVYISIFPYFYFKSVSTYFYTFHAFVYIYIYIYIYIYSDMFYMFLHLWGFYVCLYFSICFWWILYGSIVFICVIYYISYYIYIYIYIYVYWLIEMFVFDWSYLFIFYNFGANIQGGPPRSVNGEEHVADGLSGTKTWRYVLRTSAVDSLRLCYESWVHFNANERF